MFETEDMLPRPPPKPSAPLLAVEGSVKPEVPEVSIIFGKPSNTAPIASSQQPQSYAEWRKQVLPQCSQSNTKDQANIAARSTVFPLRSTRIPAAIPHVQKNEPLVVTLPPTEKTFRHSLENASGQTAAPCNCIQNSEHRRSVDSLCQRKQSAVFSTEALTICASTQTDFPTADIKITKQDFDCLMKAVTDLQAEQQQTRRLLEALLVQQEKQQQIIMTSVVSCDVATQCESILDNPKQTLPQNNFHYDNGAVQQALPNVKIYSPVMENAPRPVLPAAQSTQYRCNTPFKSNIQQLPLANLAAPTNPYIPSLPKPCTEKSMVMNELALKYLPSDKLNELMENIDITTEQTPLREIDNNLNKACTDISTASFHYLRKYRLLPHQQKQQQTAGSPPQNVYNTSDPTTNQLVTKVTVESPHLDLEHIKRQPKFL